MQKNIKSNQENLSLAHWPASLCMAFVFGLSGLFFVASSTTFSFAQEPTKTPSPKNVCGVSVESLMKMLKAEDIGHRVGRHQEVSRLIQALQRNRPALLLGNEGSGRTAIVEILVKRIKEGDVPSELKDLEVISFDWKLASNSQDLMMGEGQKTPETLLAERIHSATNGGKKKVILHIPDIDQLFATGDAQVQIPAAQKALAARIRLLVAEGKVLLVGEGKSIRPLENDSISKQLESISVKDLPASEVRDVLLREVKTWEEKFGVTVDGAAIDAALTLSKRYFPTSPQVEMAKNLLEHSGVIAQAWNGGRNARIDLLERQIRDVQESLEIVNQRPDLYRQAIREMEAQLERLQSQLRENKLIFDQIRPLNEQMEALKQEKENLLTQTDQISDVVQRAANAEQIRQIDRKMAEVLKQIDNIQNEHGISVTANVNALMVVEAVRARRDGPVNYSGTDNLEMAANLIKEWKKLVQGQDRALEEMANIIELDLIGLRDPLLARPRGVFILAGPTGTGKDWSMETLNSILTHGATEYRPINGNELMTKEGFGKLAGADAGYVGYGPGELTTRIRENPDGVVGITEGDKMHGDIHKGMMQLYETGKFEGKDGTLAIARNNIVSQTTNLGDEFYNPLKLREIAQQLQTFEDVKRTYGHLAGFEKLDIQSETAKFDGLVNVTQRQQYLKDLFIGPDGKFTEIARSGIEESIRSRFPPEVLGRVDKIVIFDPLSRQAITEIVDTQIARFKEFPFLKSGEHEVVISPEAHAHLIDTYQAVSLSGGARGLRSLVRDEVLMLIKDAAINRQLSPGQQVHVLFEDGRIRIEARNP